jgi:hypothetical protein
VQICNLQQTSTGPAVVSLPSADLADYMQTHQPILRRAPGLAVQLKGWPTAGKVTGQGADLSEILFRVTGTSSHKTIHGGSVTIYDMEVVKPLVVGDVVRLPFASGTVRRTVDNNSCVVDPCGQKENDYFVSILVKGWWYPQDAKVRLDQTLFRVAGTLRIDHPKRESDYEEFLTIYDLEVVEPPSK